MTYANYSIFIIFSINLQQKKPISISLLYKKKFVVKDFIYLNHDTF